MRSDYIVSLLAQDILVCIVKIADFVHSISDLFKVVPKRNLADTHDERYEIAFQMTMCNYMKKRK